MPSYFLYPNSAFFMQMNNVDSVQIFRAIRTLTDHGKNSGEIAVSKTISVLYSREIDARDVEQIVVQVKGVS